MPHKFGVKKGLREGDPLLTRLLNINVRYRELQTNRTIYN